MSSLQRTPSSFWSSPLVKRSADDTSIFLVRANPELRAFVRVLPNGHVELFDVIREETLRQLVEQQGRVSADR